MKIDYKNLTEDELERCVEFVHWYKVPSELLTPKIKEEFASFQRLSARIWLEEFFDSLQKTEERKIITDYWIFKKDNLEVINFSISINTLSFRLSTFNYLNKNFRLNYEETKFLIKNEFCKRFKTKKVRLVLWEKHSNF